MGVWESVKNALVPTGRSKTALQEDLEMFRERAGKYESKYEDLRDDYDELMRVNSKLKDRIHSLELELEQQKQSRDVDDDDNELEPLTPTEQKLLDMVSDNADRIGSKDDILDLVSEEMGKDWKMSTLTVYLSQIKGKGHGDLKTVYE